jgi:hypothetical protein
MVWRTTTLKEKVRLALQTVHDTGGILEMGWDRTKLSPELRRKIAAAEAQALARRIPAAQPQPNPGNALDQSAQAESGSAARVTVRLTRRAVRLLDIDNLPAAANSLSIVSGTPASSRTTILEVSSSSSRKKKSDPKRKKGRRSSYAEGN